MAPIAAISIPRHGHQPNHKHVHNQNYRCHPAYRNLFQKSPMHLACGQWHPKSTGSNVFRAGEIPWFQLRGLRSHDIVLPIKTRIMHAFANLTQRRKVHHCNGCILFEHTIDIGLVQQTSCSNGPNFTASWKPVTRLSKVTGANPSCCRALQTCDHIYPAPPVTSLWFCFISIFPDILDIFVTEADNLFFYN